MQPTFFPFGDARPVTAAHLKMRWSGSRAGERFRCYLCGHKFKLGDMWRALYANDRPGTQGNILVCGDCDTDDALDRYLALCKTINDVWWLRRD